MLVCGCFGAELLKGEDGRGEQAAHNEREQYATHIHPLF
jgi:hypothetical protein